MSAFSEHKEELEHFQTMMGPQRGALAVTLDLLTNALVLVGRDMHFGRWYQGGVIAAGVLFVWQQWLIRKRDRGREDA